MNGNIFTPFTENERCLQFAYNMNGAAMGTLKVDLSSSTNGAFNTVFTRNSNTGDVWTDTEVTIPSGTSKVCSLSEYNMEFLIVVTLFPYQIG